MTKTCSKCKNTKNTSDFFTDNQKSDKLSSRCKLCYKIHYNSISKNYYKTHRNERREYRKEYYKKNKDKLNKYSVQYNKDRFENDFEFKLKQNLRNRIRKAIKNGFGQKAHQSKELLGCDWETVRHHIESQFTEGMSWENHGIGGWHIDHIKPCASFDLSDPEEQKKCFHYTNLQPLWAEDNISKSDTY